jgi:hypothetical protein
MLRRRQAGATPDKEPRRSPASDRPPPAVRAQVTGRTFTPLGELPEAVRAAHGGGSGTKRGELHLQASCAGC